MAFTAADIRQRMSALQAKLKLILPLSEDLSNIRIGDNKNHNKLLKLSNKYKEWQFAISDLTSDNWKDKRDYLYKLLQQGSALLEELNQQKLTMRSLSSSTKPCRTRTIQQRWADVLTIRNVTWW